MSAFMTFFLKKIKRKNDLVTNFFFKLEPNGSRIYVHLLIQIVEDEADPSTR